MTEFRSELSPQSVFLGQRTSGLMVHPPMSWSIGNRTPFLGSQLKFQVHGLLFTCYLFPIDTCINNINKQIKLIPSFPSTFMLGIFFPQCSWLELDLLFVYKDITAHRWPSGFKRWVQGSPPVHCEVSGQLGDWVQAEVLGDPRHLLLPFGDVCSVWHEPFLDVHSLAWRLVDLVKASSSYHAGLTSVSMACRASHHRWLCGWSVYRAGA